MLEQKERIKKNKNSEVLMLMARTFSKIGNKKKYWRK